MRLRIAAVSLGFLLVAGGASPAWAQSPPASPMTIPIGDWLLSPTLEIRSRGEYWRDPVELGGGMPAGTLVNGTYGPRVRSAGGGLERTRLGVGADKGALRAQLTLQDSRAWGVPYPTATLGGTTSLAPSLAAFGPYEAYIEAHTSDETRPTYLRVGRQAVVWGDGRLLGNSDWSPAPRSLDAVRAHLAVGHFDFELLGAILDAPTPPSAAFGASTGATPLAGTELFAAQAAWTIDPLLVLQAFGFARIARSGEGGTTLPRSFALAAADGNTYTGALRIAGDKSGWRYALEGAYQAGTASDLTAGGVNRSAYAGAAYLSKRLERVALTPTIRIGGAYASGDDGNGTYKGFDPLLPDTHVLHGAMDVFAWSNEIEGNARVTVVPVAETTVSVEYRYAQMATASGEWLDAYLLSVGRAAGNTSTSLGSEFDAVFTWHPWTALDLVAGYSLYLLGDGARTILAAEGRGATGADGTYDPTGVAHYGYLQATLHVP
jgi:Alginate export